jgi:hypothetical protein
MGKSKLLSLAELTRFHKNNYSDKNYLDSLDKIKLKNLVFSYNELS